MNENVQILMLGAMNLSIQLTTLSFRVPCRFYLTIFLFIFEFNELISLTIISKCERADITISLKQFYHYFMRGLLNNTITIKIASNVFVKGKNTS